MINIASVFSGIGTPELALKAMNIPHHTVFAAEIDKYARQTYLANNQEPDTFYEDVTKIDGTKYLGKVDVVVGGSPCQAFSIAGKQGGFEDTRGTLFFEYARLVKESQPKVFIYENVKGLISHDKPKQGVELNGVVYKKGYPSLFNSEYDGKKKGLGKTFHIVENTFKELGYHIFWDVVNTKDYGIPQNRERIYVVGFRKGLVSNTLFDDAPKFEFAPKQELHLRLKDMLEDSVDSKYLLSQKLVTYFDKHKEEHDSKGNGFGWKPTDGSGVASAITARVFKMGATDNYIKLNQTHTLNIKGNDSIKRIYHEDGLCPALTTMGGGHREPKVAIEKNIVKLFDIPKEVLNDNERQRRVYSTVCIAPSVLARSDSSKVAQCLDTACNKAVFWICKSIKPSVAKNIQREMDDILRSDKDFYVCKADAGWQDNKVGLQTSPTIRANNSSLYALDRPNYIFRKLTPRECFRLQGFGDDFVFPMYGKKPMSDTQLYKQAGNGMSRNILEMIFKHIFKVVEL